MDDYINETLVDMARNSDGWRDLRNMLNDIPTGYDYYIRDEYDEFREADDDEFEDYKSSVIAWGDNEMCGVKMKKGTITTMRTKNQLRV